MDKVTNIQEHSPVTRGDDIVFPKPYAGIVRFRDGRYIVAGRERGRLVMVDENDVVISSGDPLSLRHNYDRTVCYGIAEHIMGDAIYLLVGEENDTELWITRIEVLPNNTFKWLPTWDVRVPSVAARNKNYATKKPVYVSNDLGAVSPMGFITSILPLGDETPWDEIKDVTVLELDDFNQLGPVLPEYNPSIAPLGSRVLVSVNNVQLFQVYIDLCLTYGAQALDEEKAQWEQWLANSFPGERFVYGQDHDWWLEQGTNWTRMHFHMTFQYPAILSSLVIIHPDTGMVENVTHIGSSLVCAASDRSEVGYPISELDHEHYEKKNFINVLTTACEADINLSLARQTYYVPSNPLTWSDSLPPLTPNSDGYAYTDLITWWVRAYVPYIRTMDPIAFVRQQPQSTLLVFMATTREGALLPQVRSKIERAQTYIDYEILQPVYPWNDVEGINGGSRELCSDTVMVVTNTKILSGQVARYILETRYNGRLLGRGLDVYVGKVLKGKPKIVQVSLINEGGSPFMHLRDITVSIVADFDYPYYQYTRIRKWSDDPWGMSINYPYQLQPSPLLDNYFTFEIKVETDSTIEDPKPVLLDVSYKKTGQ